MLFRLPDDHLAIHSRVNGTTVPEGSGGAERPIDGDIANDVDVSGRAGLPGGEDDVVIVAENLEPNDVSNVDGDRKRAERVAWREYFDDVGARLRSAVAGGGGERQRDYQDLTAPPRRLHAAYTVARRAAFASLFVTFASCADAGPKSPISPYALVSVDSKPLPVVMYEEESYRLEITGGTLELTEPDSYELTLTVVETVDGNKSTYIDRESGSWVLGDQGAIAFTGIGAIAFTGNWHRTQLTVTRDEGTFSFEMTGR
jgi:hypothetical protein